MLLSTSIYCKKGHEAVLTSRNRKYCRICRKVTQDIWNSNNRSKIRKIQAIYRKKHKDKFVLARKKWLVENRDKEDNRSRLKTWKRYGIDMTIEKYETLLVNQMYCCGICGREASKFKTRLAVDHDHKTGESRGLLCGMCNRVLVGMFESHGNLLLRTQQYMAKYQHTFDAINKVKSAIQDKVD